MRVLAQKATLVLRNVLLGGQLRIEEIRLESDGATFQLGSERSLRADGTIARVVVSEVSANDVLAATQIEGIRDLKIALLAGKVRLEGRYGIVGPLSVPFTLTGALEVDGGTGLRFQPLELNVVGASLGGVAQSVGERINARLREAVDLSNLPFACRLAKVDCEPGRLVAEAVADIEVRRAAAALEPVR